MPVEKDISPLEKAMMTAQVQNIFGDKQSYEYEGAAAESTYQPYGTMYDYTEPMQGGDEMSMVESMLSPGPGYDVLGRMKGKWESGKPMQAAGELPLLMFALASFLGGRRMTKKLMKKMAQGKLTKAEAAKVDSALEHVRRTGEGVLAADNPLLQGYLPSAPPNVPYRGRLLYSSPAGPVPAPLHLPQFQHLPGSAPSPKLLYSSPAGPVPSSISLPAKTPTDIPGLIDMSDFIKGRR